MIRIKNKSEIEKMRAAGRIAANALRKAEEAIRPGISTLTLDRIIREYIASQNAHPSFLRLYGFPNSACISVNEEVIHGLPSRSVKLKEGDIVSVDVGAKYQGYHGDNTKTFAVGEISADTKKLLEVTRDSLYKAIDIIKPDVRIGDISHTIESYCRSFGYGIVRNYCGHGIGSELHEDPEVPNFGEPGRGVRLKAGMTIAIEPMINAVGDDVYVHQNGWTVIPRSHSMSAHFEHTVAVTQDGALILTTPDL